MTAPRLIRRSAVAAVAIGVVAGAALPTLASGGDRTDSVRSAIQGGKARNVILLIVLAPVDHRTSRVDLTLSPGEGDW